MQVHTLTGSVVEIGPEEANRIHNEVHKKTPLLSRLSQGTSKEHGYYSHMRDKAAEHICAAAHCSHPPKDEAEVKEVIAHVLETGDAKAIAEVIYEAFEWGNASAVLMAHED
jgi:hypothetical protein